jgi:hypothetical protein
VHPLDVPPYFDGNDYVYWKARMRVFLKCMDEKVWFFVEKVWTKNELSESHLNIKGLNAIFMAVSDVEFKRICRCETSKEAWDILETTHAGTQFVKNSKLQILNSMFEKIRMEEDETFDDFYAKLNDLVNATFNLGHRIPESIIVRKVMRSLPKRFRPKLADIMKSEDLDSLKIEELVGFLNIYELTLLKNYLIEYDIIKGTSSENSQNKKDFEDRKEKKTQDSDGRKEKKTQEILCSGYGHMRFECPNYLKSKGKATNATLSDESESDELNGNIIAYALQNM